MFIVIANLQAKPQKENTPKATQKISTAKQKANIEKAALLGSEAIYLINQQKNNEAIEKLKEAQKLDKESITYPYEIAVAYYNKEEFGKSIKLLDSLRSHRQVNPQIYQLLGNSFDYLARRQEARNIYEEGLRKFPKSGRLYLELGIVEIQEEKEELGLKTWIKGTEVDPNYANTYYRLAELYNKRKELIKAILNAEIFINLSDNQKKSDEMSVLILNIYINAYVLKDSVYYFDLVSQSKRSVTFLESSYNNYINAAAKAINLKSELTLDYIIELRKFILMDWYKDKINEKYPNQIIDFNKKVLDAGFFEIYSRWIFSGANQEEFMKWAKENSQSVSKFTIWLQKNYFNIK